MTLLWANGAFCKIYRKKNVELLALFVNGKGYVQVPSDKDWIASDKNRNARDHSWSASEGIQPITYRSRDTFSKSWAACYEMRVASCKSTSFE